MSSYRRYQEARDTAWRALLRLETKALPVDAEALAHQAGVEVLPFPEPREEPKLRAMIEKAGGGRCVSLRFRGGWKIFLKREGWDEANRRFAVAHELGHLFLGHETYALSPGVRAFRGRQNAGDLLEEPDGPEEEAADMFAIRLLSPACLLHEMHVDTPGGIMRLCGLPPRAAMLRAERMALLNQRDSYYTHPLERQVRDAFLPFLQREKAAIPAPRPAPTPARGLVQPLRVETPPRKTEAARKKKRGPLWALPAAALAAFLLLFFLLRP